MSAFDTLRYDKRDGAGAAIAVVTLCRPEAINAFNVRMRDELSEALSAARDDDEVRGLLIAGDGERGFCAGADLTEFGSAPSQAVARYVRWARDLWSTLAELPKPTMAAVHGYCFAPGWRSPRSATCASRRRTPSSRCRRRPSASSPPRAARSRSRASSGCRAPWSSRSPADG